MPVWVSWKQKEDTKKEVILKIIFHISPFFQDSTFLLKFHLEWKKWYNIRYKWKKCLINDLRSLDPNIYLYFIVSNAFYIFSSSVLFLGKSFFRIFRITGLGLVADFCPSAVWGWADCVSGFTSVNKQPHAVAGRKADESRAYPL